MITLFKTEADGKASESAFSDFSELNDMNTPTTGSHSLSSVKYFFSTSTHASVAP